MSSREIYSGSERKPIVTIEGLIRGIDYSVRYEDNVKVGIGKAIITGKGQYTGEVTKTFIIYRNISKMEANLSYVECEYDGKEKTPKVTMEGMTEGKDYTVSYKNNVNVGEARVTIKGV